MPFENDNRAPASRSEQVLWWCLTACLTATLLAHLVTNPGRVAGLSDTETAEEAAVLVGKAEALQQRYFDQQDFSPTRTRQVRDRLWAFGEMLYKHFPKEHGLVQLHMRAVVSGGRQHFVGEPVDRAQPREEQVAFNQRHGQFQRELSNPPEAVYKYNDPPGIALLKFCGNGLWFFYQLFIPFGAAIILVRLRRQGRSVDEEVRYGLGRFLLAVFTGPVGLWWYSDSLPAFLLHCRMVEMAYRVRRRLRWSQELTQSEGQLITELARMPRWQWRDEMDRRLGIVRSAGWALVPQWATYAASYAALLLSLVSSLVPRGAFAESGTMKGVVQLRDSKSDGLSLEAARFIGRLPIASGVSLSAVHDFDTNAVKEAAGQICWSKDRVCVRGGRFFTRVAPPTLKQNQYVIGSAEQQLPLLQLSATGSDVVYSNDPVTLSLAVLMDSDPKGWHGVPRDFLLTGRYKLAAFVADAAVQLSKLKDEWRTRTFSRVGWAGALLFGDAYFSTEIVGDKIVWAMTGMGGVRPLPQLELTGGYAETHTTGQGTIQALRLQTTWIIDAATRIAIMGKGSPHNTWADWNLVGRLQFAF